MGNARTAAGHFAWVMWGVVALGGHVLLLWSVPGAAVETALAAATTAIWETEAWEALEPSSPATAPSEAIAAPLGQPAASAPKGASSVAPAQAIAAQPKAATRARGTKSQPSAAAGARPAAALPTHEEVQADTGAHAANHAKTHAATAAAREEAQAANAAPLEEAQAATAREVTHAATAAAREEAQSANARDADAALLAQATHESGPRAPGGDSADAQRAAAGQAAISGSGANGQGQGALMRGPRLLATPDPCAGFFPGTAAANRGQVQLSVDVDAQGIPHPTQTLLELPSGQGFENAAKACAAHLHFAPALDAQGHPVNAQARIALRFERS